MLRIIQIIAAAALVILLFRTDRLQGSINVLRFLGVAVLILAIIPSVRFSFSIEGFPGANFSAIDKQAGTAAFDPHFLK